MPELKMSTRIDKPEFSLLNFEGLRIRVASPEDIERWSHGEVLKPETINYRTQKPERDGLFDERIFGPTKDWECYCGKYKRIRYKGVICDKCGVEVTRSSVRRERMGHIDLAVPVAHIWYVRGVPYTISTVLDISVSNIERVVYFASFVVISVKEDLRAEALEQLESEYKAGKELLKDSEERLEIFEQNYKTTKADLNSLESRTVLSEGKFHELSMRFGNIAKVGIGAEAIRDLLKDFDIDSEIEVLKKEINIASTAALRRLTKRLRMLTDLNLAGIKVDWFIVNKLPVLPPDLRPMVQLDGGRFASSDLNDLYRRVINRNNRLKRLLNQGAPDVIVRNEKRMLQEAVDALIDNSARKTQTTMIGRQPKSLSDMLRGKQGRFRQNLLGKRVDYSARSVIVVGPKLKIDQCGLPKIMALELFKPFVISRLINDGYVHNVKNATRLIERGTPEVWEILEDVTKDNYVLLNRAPTLHRLGIQAFKPKLIEGKAIQLHPLVCAAYNADFDGDQMAVHVPLSNMARHEAKEIMASNNNLLKPSSGEPLVAPRLDIVFGLFYLTNISKGVVGEGKAFALATDVELGYQRGELSAQAEIEFRVNGQRIKTSVGRVIINEIFPADYPFINDALDTRKLKAIMREIYKLYGKKVTAKVADDLMTLGFKFAEKSGMTMSIFDINVPKSKKKLIEQGEEAVDGILKRYRRGLISEDERRRLSIDKWTEIRNKMEKEVKNSFPVNSAIWTMVTSGARGSSNQLVQLAGMKGLVVNPSGSIIEVPITSNYKDGLNVLEYFISTHGSRKGKSDTSLKTADAGYLTRRLVDVSQDLVVTEKNCETKNFVRIIEAESEKYGETYQERLVGRATAETIKDQQGKIIVKKGVEITEDDIPAIIKSKISSIKVRSTLHCRARWGICQLCYGRDLATGERVIIGSAVGIMAAQAIGEPGTQLTMKTFHLGGVSGGGDITSGLPRVEEIFEARPPHDAAVLSEIAGTVVLHEAKEKQYIDVIGGEILKEKYHLTGDYQPSVKTGDIVKAKQAIATSLERKAIRSAIAGRIMIKGKLLTITSAEPIKASYTVVGDNDVLVKNGDKVEVGQQLTEGHIDPHLGLELMGMNKIQDYIIREVQSIYASHGAGVNEKHIEIIARSMFSKVRLLDGGDSTLMQGQVISRLDIERMNVQLKKAGKIQATYEQIVLGITRASLQTNSFLSAASFQETTRVLIEAAIRGAVDPLRGLKENVIIGKLIPAGTGYDPEMIGKPEIPEKRIPVIAVEKPTKSA